MADGRLLVLDDDEAVAQTVAFVAEQHGFAVRTTSEPEDFFNQINAWSPTHIVIDLVMPAMDGVEVLRSLAGSGCVANIIVMSGMGAKILDSARRGAAERGLRIGGILPKPFKPAELRALLEQPVPNAGTQRTAEPAPAVADDAELGAAELAQALRQHDLVLHYQPKIRIASREPAGFEALVRWQHPRLGLVPPDRFIGLAERSGLMDALTGEVLELGLDWFAGISGDLSLSFSLSLALNVSARNLGDVDFADLLQARCRAHGIDPARVILELTESSAMQDATVALDILTRIRIKGFKLSIDDFGTGYSSMMQLAKLPVSELKIDRSFVASMIDSAESRKIVESTIGLGRGLGLTTVAEGVEDARTLDLLETLGCDLAQGYHIARAMEGGAARRWLAEWQGGRGNSGA